MKQFSREGIRTVYHELRNTGKNEYSLSVELFIRNYYYVVIHMNCSVDLDYTTYLLKNLLFFDPNLLFYFNFLNVAYYSLSTHDIQWMCMRCVNLIKRETVERKSYSRLIRPMGPQLPKNFLTPHRCTLSTLKLVDTFRRYNWIDDALHEQWLQSNSGSYLTATDPASLKFWEDRLSKSKLVMKDQKPWVGDKYVVPSKCRIHGVLHPQLRQAPSKRSQLKLLNELYPYSSDTDKSHTNLDIASVIHQTLSSRYIPGAISIINRVLRLLPTGLSNITVTAMIVHAIGNNCWPHLADLVERDRACCLEKSAYVEYFKAVSIALRRTGRWPDGSEASLDEIASCAYFELPIGRSGNISKWDDEVQNRTVLHLPLADVSIRWDGTRNATTNAQYLRRYELELHQIMKELVRANDKWLGWQDFVMSRQSWSASGSAGGQKMDVAGSSVRINKHSYFESLTSEEMMEWIDTKPEIRATASEKFEMGKARAIYGTEPRDYTIVTHVIMGIEPKLSRIHGVELGLNGFDELQCINRRAVRMQQPRQECTMVDYADFNKQHTLEAQALIFKCLADRMEQIGANRDAIRSARWCQQAHLNQYCRFPNLKEGGEEYKRIVQGMFSGNRATNFINTIANVAYYRVARKQVDELFGLRPEAEYTVHQGDDVWIVNQSRLWAISLFKVMKATGFEFQASKQLFAVNRGEFLRVMYSSEGARGFLARAVSTFIVNPIQNPTIVGPVEKATALNSQLHVLFRRGLTQEACDILWQATVAFYLKHPRPGGGGTTVPLSVAKAPYTKGGLDLGPPATFGSCKYPLPTLPRAQTYTRELETAIPRHMSEDWVRVLSAKLTIDIDAEAVRTLLHRSNVSDSLREKDRIMSLRIWEREMESWSAKMKAVPRLPSSREPLMVPPPDCYIPVTGLEVIRRIVQARPERKTNWWRQMPLETIPAAIAQSPYRDLSTAQAALSLGPIQAAKMAIQACRGDRLRDRARSALLHMNQQLPDDVVARILEGVRGVGVAYESIFNPVILSWLCKVASAIAVEQACHVKVRTTKEWDSLLNVWQVSMISYGYHQLQLHRISRF